MWISNNNKKLFFISKGSAKSECFIPPGVINPLRLTRRPIVQSILNDAQTNSQQSTNTNRSVSYTSESFEKATYSKYSSSSSNRVRRNINPEMLRPENLTDARKHEIIHLDCEKSTIKCLQFTCQIYNMAKKSEAYIKIRGVLRNATLLTYFPRVDGIKIYSSANITIPYSYGIHTDTSDDYKTVATHAYRELIDQVIDKSIPYWIYILAILLGLLLLAILSYCFYRIGFFKRKRPDPTLSGNLEKSAESKPFIAN